MGNLRRLVVLTIVVMASCVWTLSWTSQQRSRLPAFGRDTVLVWKMQYSDDVAEFVVRIAEFLPDRFIEWENATTQGTIFMSKKAITIGKAFVNARLFEGGMDTKGKDATTLWLSQQIFRDLKSKKRVKVTLDAIDCWLTLDGSDQMTIEVNRAMMAVPVIRVKDDRGSERWFLDLEENALLAMHRVRTFTQTLTSITTDKSNTLRWIKGKKLASPH